MDEFELQRLRRNREENEICELWDAVRELKGAVRELKLDVTQLKMALELAKKETILEKWIARSR